MADIEIRVELEGRENLVLSLKCSGEENSKKIESAQLAAIGGPDLLNLVVEWRPKLQGLLAEVPLPEGSSTPAILLRELILKAQGLWNYPYKHEELCHCRAISTEVVDRAIVTGAHTPEKVSRQTSASTACGTCRPDVEEILRFRLGS